MDREFNQLIGRNTRNQRKYRNWSQHCIANALNISYQQVAKYESGINVISPFRLKVLSELFGCSIQDFFYDAEAAWYNINHKPFVKR